MRGEKCSRCAKVIDETTEQPLALAAVFHCGNDQVGRQETKFAGKLQKFRCFNGGTTACASCHARRLL